MRSPILLPTDGSAPGYGMLIAMRPLAAAQLSRRAFPFCASTMFS